MACLAMGKNELHCCVYLCARSLWGFLCVRYHTSMLVFSSCLLGSYLMMRSVLACVDITWPCLPSLELLAISPSSSSTSTSTTHDITAPPSDHDVLLLAIVQPIIVIV